MPLDNCVQALAGVNSAGLCWQLTYNSSTIFVLAGSGFSIGLSAMNAPTNKAAVNLSRVDAGAVQVDKSKGGTNLALQDCILRCRRSKRAQRHDSWRNFRVLDILTSIY